MNMIRGLIAGLLGTLVGLLGPVLIVGSYTLLYWYFHETPEMDRRADMKYWRLHAVMPLAGSTIYLGLTAWATFTPRGDYRFARTLVILFCIALPLTGILMKTSLTPERRPYDNSPPLYFSEFLIMLLTPTLVAATLIIIRSRRKEETDTNELSENQ
ncbi:MAG: hypothetical protein KDA70_16400 [Planctomycetaceae bacterium]|nr:hypothetical protein [Planctomycetaceae bacterium]